MEKLYVNVADSGGDRSEARQIEVALKLVGVVAVVAVFLQKRQHLRRVPPRQILRRKRPASRECPSKQRNSGLSGDTTGCDGRTGHSGE